jgi:hypothetical protein
MDVHFSARLILRYRQLQEDATVAKERSRAAAEEAHEPARLADSKYQVRRLRSAALCKISSPFLSFSSYLPLAACVILCHLQKLQTP